MRGFRKHLPFIALATAIVLVCAGILMVLHDEASFRAQKTQETTVQAKILASIVTAALAFDDRDAAQEYVEATRTDPETDIAAVYDAKGALFAVFSRSPDNAAPARLDPRAAQSVSGQIIALSPVVQDDRVLGTIYLARAIEPLTARLERYGMIVLLVTMAGLMFAALAIAQKQLVNQAAMLDLRVRERTSELEEANQALKQTAQRLAAQFDRLSLLDRITRAVAERQDMQSIFQAVIRSLEDQLPIDFGCIAIYEDNEKTLRLANVGVKSPALAQSLARPEKARIPVDENGLSRCLRGELLYEPDASRVPFAFAQRVANGGLKSLIIAPLMIERRAFGILAVARADDNAFNSTDCEFLKQLAEHVALAVKQAQLHATLQTAYDDLRQTRQAVLQQERLRALGQMASGIAHDINNAISPMALHTQVLREHEKNLSPRIGAYIDLVNRVTNDVAATVARLREFYREHDPRTALGPIDLDILVEQVVELTRARWDDMPKRGGTVIEMRLELEGGLPPVRGIENEVREALTNLVFNAVDAMPDGGTLTLRTERLADGGQPARVRIEIIDTGVGMDEETRRRCIEPFFTTKGDRGTGLGLAMVYGVIQRHVADLDIESEVGKGTIFRLDFPVADAAAELSIPTPASKNIPPVSILAIDDDPVILDSMRLVLELDGHSVEAVNDARLGVERFRAAFASDNPFAIVITDLGMPYMDGGEVARAIKEISPTTPIILLTGWGRRMSGESEPITNVDRTLDKPPKLPELREALASLLAGSSSE